MHDSEVVRMKKSKFTLVSLVLGLFLILLPVVSASAVPFGNSLIKTDTEFSGDAVVNETIDLKWSTGMDTYEWKQSSVYSNTLGQKTQSVFDFRQVNGSTGWSFQRSGYNMPSQAPIYQYVDDHSIMKPQYRIGYPEIMYMPGIQFT